MKIHNLISKQTLPIKINEAWDYFSNPKNLQEITPDYLGFKITSELPEKMYQGMIVTYKVKPLFNIPINWVTEITTVDDKKLFIDEQRFGPYKFWHHQHKFKEVENGTEMIDIVHYGFPFGIFGNIAHKLFIHKQLKGIFDYRYEYLMEKYKKLI